MPKFTLDEISFLINMGEWDALTEEDCGYYLEALKRRGPEMKKVIEKIEKKVEEDGSETEEDGSETYFRAKKDSEKVPSSIHPLREKAYGWGFRAI